MEEIPRRRPYPLSRLAITETTASIENYLNEIGLEIRFFTAVRSRNLTTQSPAATYTGVFTSARSQRIMEKGNILTDGITPRGLIDRTREAIGAINSRWDDAVTSRRLADEFCGAVEAGICTLGTPALTHLARGYGSLPLSSCIAGPPIEEDLDIEAIEASYALNMGAGYNLDACDDPAGALIALDQHAAEFERTAKPARYVGNIAHVSARHPHAREFIMCKARSPKPLSRFNVSVDFSEQDIAALEDPASPASGTLEHVADAAWACGDPGVISLDRFNAANPLRRSAPYRTVAPCAELGLAQGDTCVFAYISLPALLRGLRIEDFDVAKLRRTVRMLVRVLDGIVEHSGAKLPSPLGRRMAVSKRRMAIGVCGFADLLLWLGIPYTSVAAESLLADVLSVVSLEALRVSHQLGLERGSYPATAEGDALITPSPPASGFVSRRQWRELGQLVVSTGVLRHSCRTALPPAGRSARLLGVSPSIEPLAGKVASHVLHEPLRRHLIKTRPDPQVTLVAASIPWQRHLAIACTASRYLDESLSKTVNLPTGASRRDVREVMSTALRSGLKAISVYRQTTSI